MKTAITRNPPITTAVTPPKMPPSRLGAFTLSGGNRETATKIKGDEFNILLNVVIKYHNDVKLPAVSV